MIKVAPAAQAQIQALADHYFDLGRVEALSRLAECVEAACTRKIARRELFYAAPRPYPALAKLGLVWTKEGAYWLAFIEAHDGDVLAGVFYESADITRRV